MKYKFTKLSGNIMLTLLISFLITQSYAQCPTLFNTEATANVACSGDQVTFTALLNPADAQNGSLSVELGSGNVLIPTLTGPNPSGLYTGSLTLENDGCYPITNSYAIRLVCNDDGSTSAIQTEDITVYPTSVEEFIVVEGDDCSASVGLSEACTDADGVLHLGVETTEFTAEPGESGTWSINYNFIDKLGLNPCPGGALSGTIEYDYDCFDPCGNFAGEMGGSTFVCGNNGFIVAPIENDAIVDAGSTQVFVIHGGTSSQIGPDIYAVVGPGEPIMNDGTIPTNVSLCFSSVVGDQLDTNGIPQPDGCYDISDDCQIVVFLDPITVSATEICDPETGTYDLQVMFNGGGPGFFPGHTYDVTGAISGSVLAGDFNTFGTFNSGEDYSFEIADDGKGCRLSYDFSATCDIIPDCDAGVLGGNAFVCDGEFVVASSVGFEYGGDSQLIYVLHDGSSDAIGSNIYGTAADGVLASDGSVPTNVTLCISAVVGDDIGTDGIPQDSGSGGCYDISNCFQVVFLDPITVETNEICDLETGQYTVEVSITGGGPSFFAGHTYTVTGDLAGDIEAGETTTMGPFDSGYTYSFEVTEDGKGCSLDEPITGTADCGVYDLALTKTVASPGPFAPGDDVLFTIAVINQGNTDANNVEVTDYISAGMTLSSNDNNGWTVSGSNATTTIPSIAAGSTSIINILLTVDAGQGEGPIVNYAEISGDDGDDVDSNTDQDIANDAGGIPNSPTDNATNGTKGGDDEDDHDPAQIEIVIPSVYDLALIKTVSSAGPFMPGDDVTFTIEVINQGGVDANNVEVTDYIPAGMTLSSSDNNGWTVSGSNATATIASIAAGASATIDIVLTIDASQGAGSLVNYAEISGDDGDDADSNTDQDIGNDAGGVPNSPTDDSTDGTKGGDDEDDHDPAQIDVTVPAVYDLALVKTVSSTGPFMPGDDVTYTIEVFNQGDVDANNVEITDYIPSGMTLSTNDNNGWIVSGSNATVNISSIAAGASATVDIVLTIDASQGAGSLVNYAEISGDDGDDVDSNTDQDAGNDAGGVPNSSTDDSTDGTKGGTDEDDHDPAQIDVTVPAVYDLALIKTVAYTGPFAPGSDVLFAIEVINQGDVDANNVEITDYIPAGLSLSTNDNNGWVVSGSTATVNIVSIPSGSSVVVNILLTIDNGQPDGPLVNYAEISGDDGDDIDSNTDQDIANDAGGVPNSSTDNSTDGTKGGDDEDDHDPAQINVMTAIAMGCTDPCADNYDPLAEVNDGSCNPYSTTCNTDCTLGNIEVWSPVDCSCIISSVTVLGCLDENACNYDPNANCADNSTCDYGNTACSDPCNPVPGCTNAAACNYNPNACVDDGSCDLGNPACSDPCNEVPGCTNPAACNYNPDACVDNGTCELGNLSCSDPCSPVSGCTNPSACNYDPAACIDNGSCNPGNPTCSDPCNPAPGCTNATACNYDPAACIDDGSCEFGDSTCPSSPCNPTSGCTDPSACNYDASACVDDGSCQAAPVCNNDPCAGDITAPNATDCTCEVVTPQVLGCTDPAACNYNSAANCDDDSCVPCEVFDLALIKDISPNLTNANNDIYCPGEEVRFSIAVYNQGAIDAIDTEITDYIPEGMSLSDNPANSIWTVNGSMATTIIPLIEANGDVVGLTIFLTIDEDYTGATLENYAEISGDSGDDHDSNADNILGNDAGGVPNTSSDNNINGVKGGDDEDDHDGDIIYLCNPVVVEGFDLALTKSLAAGQTGPFTAGAPVTFTITVYNQGSVTATNVGIIDYAPVTLFLDDPDWTQGANGATTVIPGPIPPGGSTSVDISFIVDPSLFHSKDIANYAEIEYASDDNGNLAGDVDSTPDNQVGNDAGGAPNSPADDYIDGDGTGGQGDGVAATDEDDSDPATISVVAQACDAGVLPTEIYACSTGVVSISSTGALVPEGYQYVYVLHDGTETVFGNVIEYNTTGVFDGTNYPTNTPLTVQALVGPPKPVPTDLPVLCDLSNAATLVFLEPVQIVNPQYTCDSSTESYTVSFSITGGLPGYNPTATYNVTGDYSSSNANAGVIYTFGPTSNTTFNIYASDDAGCSASYSENVECVKLPITLLSYNGKVQEEGNLLKWVTGSEIDNDYFTLEVSNDGVNFETISTIKGAGNSSIAKSYSFLHRTALAGVSYYRLHQTDFDGTTVEVGIVELVRGESALGIVSLLPVPVLDNLQLTFTTTGNSSTEFDVLDVIGHSLIKFEKTSSKAGIDEMEIDVSELPAGVYFVRMKTGETIVSKKFIKE